MQNISPDTVVQPDLGLVETCRQSQEEEYEVLESIFPECISSRFDAEGRLKLEIPIEFDHGRKVHIVQRNHDSSESTSDGPSNNSIEVVEVSTLPPLLVNISLPTTYPAQAPPNIISIRAAHLWIPRIGILNDILTGLWQPGDGVLYNLVEHIRTGEFLEALDLVNKDGEIEIVHANPPILASLLSAHDLSSKSSQFAQNSYPCSICLTSLKGSRCLQLACQHIFCRPCLQDFWGLCIEEGDVGRVGCPDPECVKEKREAVEEEVARVVTDKEVARWRWLREKRSIDKDPTIIHCPVEQCQTPVTKPQGEDPESAWDRFRQCPKCSYSFCAFCRRTWHGTVTPCKMTHAEKIVLEYLAEEEDSEARHALEGQYGRKNILKLVAQYEEELANREWLAESTTECPGCGCHVEKNMGCNHITCWKCGKHFCYRCGTGLNGSNPYAHFSAAGSCYQKLFDFVSEEEDEWIPM